jgi:hypothetical protein
MKAIAANLRGKAAMSVLCASLASIGYACGSSDPHLFSPLQPGTSGVGGDGAKPSDGGQAGAAQGGEDDAIAGTADGLGGAGTSSGGTTGSSGASAAGTVGGAQAYAGAQAGAQAGAGDQADAGTGGVPSVIESGSHAFTLFRGPRCDQINFSAPFSAAGTNLAVHVTVVTPGSHATHDALTAWAEGITARGFLGCVSEDAGLDNNHPDFRLDWLSYVRTEVSTLGLSAGQVALSSAPGRTCQAVQFSPAYSARPQVQLALDFPASTSLLNRVSAVWAEEVTASGFRFCVEQLGNAEASLDGARIEWLAYPTSFAGSQFTAGEYDSPAFDGSSCTTIATGCPNCENAQLSINHHRRTESATDSHAATLVWAEDMAQNGDLTVCVRETSNYDGVHDAHLSVGYLLRRQND